ncbi:hypothetical protein ACTQ5J_04885 [Fundicoccus sp. Sow4_F4]|uniref:hypothetical protein n=1 Tax=Fundicoccus sp. Sow4_F4 TaxID=3438783 RepID=UPI003F912ADE
MKKYGKIMLLVALIMTLCKSQFVALARTLEESRAAVIEVLTQGLFEEFTYEEAEEYLAAEEANVLVTGYFDDFRSYGIEGSLSTAYSMIVADYLKAYSEANTIEDDLAAIYPYAVNFKKLPERLLFYHADNTAGDYADFDVTNENGRLTMYYVYWGPNQSRLNALPLEGVAVVNQTKELQVAASNHQIERTVTSNTYVDAQGPAYSDTTYKVYFFYNEEDKLSVLLWDSTNHQQTLKEYATLETRQELEGLVEGASIDVVSNSDWKLPEDWRLLSPRRGNIPPVTWSMTSTGDGETFAIEPVNQKEGVVSGFVNPTYSIQVTTVNQMTKEVISTMNATPNAEGYFSIDAGASVSIQPTIRLYDASSNLVYETDLDVYQYQPTALANDSGFLTLERYFIGQTYMEGYTYPNAQVMIMPLNGYGTASLPPIKADEKGYFYAATPAHTTNLTTNVVTVIHPETGELLTVAPYPWTQSELETAQW